MTEEDETFTESYQMSTFSVCLRCNSYFRYLSLEEVKKQHTEEDCNISLVQNIQNE